MPKYLIEGGIDFFSELYKSLDEDDDVNSHTNDNCCLISNEPLTTNFVTMECGHKFNYVPLFKDIDNHKKNFNNMEGTSSRLGRNEIRCPYCRKKQNKLLPYYENIGIPKVLGVNDIYTTTPDCKVPMSMTACKYKLYYTDNSGNEHYTTCHAVGTPINMLSVSPIHIDDNSYCWHHKKTIIKKYKTEYVEKIKQETKLAKIKQKEETKLKQQQQKENAKLEKVNLDTNVVLGPSSVINGCTSILKSGKNKGCPCGHTIINNETMLCKKHYNLKNKNCADDTHI